MRVHRYFHLRNSHDSNLPFYSNWSEVGVSLHIGTGGEEDFPRENGADWRWVMQELTKRGPLLDYKGEPWRGSVENTMAAEKRLLVPRPSAGETEHSV